MENHAADTPRQPIDVLLGAEGQAVFNAAAELAQDTDADSRTRKRALSAMQAFELLSQSLRDARLKELKASL